MSASYRYQRMMTAAEKVRLVDMVMSEASATQWGDWLAPPLEFAVLAGDVNFLRRLLALGASPNAKSFSGQRGDRILHLAAMLGNRDIVRGLLENGAVLEEHNAERRTPLHLAAMVNESSTADVLLAAGASVNLRSDQDESSAMDLAASQGHEGVMVVLLRHGSNINAATSTGRTALHTAAAANKAGAIVLLAEAGAHIDTPDQHGRTPLHIAAKENASRAVKALCEQGAGKNLPDRFDSPPLHFAISAGGGLEAVVALLHAGADANLRCGAGGCSPLDTAATSGHADIVTVLIRQGVDASARDSRGRTALHHAADRNAVGAVDALASAGADIDARDSDGRAPLHHACTWRAFGAAQALLRHGASVNAPDNQGQLPLHRAAYVSRDDNNFQIIDLLLKWDADETAVDADGHNAEEALGRDIQQELALGDLPANIGILALLAMAAVERAWRHRGLFVVSRAHPDRVRPALEGFEASVGGVVTERRAKLARAAAGGAVSDIERLVARVVGLGEEGVFRHVVNFL